MKNIPIFSELFLAFRKEQSMSLAVCDFQPRVWKSQTFLRAHRAIGVPSMSWKLLHSPAIRASKLLLKRLQINMILANEITPVTQGPPARKSWISLSPGPPKLAKCFRFFEFCGLITTSILALLGSRHPFTLLYQHFGLISTLNQKKGDHLRASDR